MLESFQPMEGGIGLKGNNLHVWQLLAQIPARADQSSGSAQARHKVSYTLIRLAQDLGPGGMVMCLPVGVVVVLVCIPVNIRFLGSQLTRRQNSAVGAFGGVCQDELRP